MSSPVESPAPQNPRRGIRPIDNEAKYISCLWGFLAFDSVLACFATNVIFGLAIVAIEFLLLKILSRRWEIPIAGEYIDSVTPSVLNQKGRKK
jgi:hypothetical protein